MVFGLADSIIDKLIDDCSKSFEDCRKTARIFMESMCSDRSLCIPPLSRKANLLEKYSWVETVIRQGVPDGRSRLILYVISRYLINVKQLPADEARLAIKEFIDNSCKNYGNCSKIYDSWIRNVLRNVERGGWLPWSREKIRERDPQLYDIIESIIE